jgi:hypothetical protein
MCIVYNSWTPTLYWCCKGFSSFGVVFDSSLPYRSDIWIEKEEEKNLKNVYVVIKICILVGFGRATRPCAACTRLFRLFYAQNGALRPPNRPSQLRCFSFIPPKKKKSTCPGSEIGQTRDELSKKSNPEKRTQNARGPRLGVYYTYNWTNKAESDDKILVEHKKKTGENRSATFFFICLFP